jgi:hypothetical protein
MSGGDHRLVATQPDQPYPDMVFGRWAAASEAMHLSDAMLGLLAAVERQGALDADDVLDRRALLGQVRAWREPAGPAVAELLAESDVAMAEY